MKYTGKLAKPIVRRRLGVLSTEESVREAATKEANEMLEKLPLLAEAHGVAPGDWFALAVSLAKTHVPGFKVVQPAGRPTEWGQIEKAELRLDVDELLAATGGLAVTDAIRRTCKLERWVEKTKGMKVTALSKHYYAADMRFVDIVRDARSWNQLSERIDSQE